MINVDISSSGSRVVTQKQSELRPTQVLEIATLWKERRLSHDEVLRRIAKEIAYLCLQSQRISCGAADPSELEQLVIYNDGLRALAKMVSEDVMSDRSDVLNLDGPKFQFVSEQIMGYIEEAIAKVLGQVRTSETAQIMQGLRKWWAENEPDLRRKIATMGTESGEQK